MNSRWGEKGRIEDFTDILAWRAGRELKRRIYALVQTFPPEERYGLAGPMRSAAVSVTANIAEGHGRYHYQENIQFCRQSRGSLCELQDHLTTCLDVGYVTSLQHQELYDLAAEALRLLNGYINWLRTRKQGDEETGNRKQ